MSDQTMFDADALRKALYYQRNREEITQHRKRRYEENREAVSAAHKAYYEENRHKVRKRHKDYYEEKKSGISVKQRLRFDEQKELQAGRPMPERCEACGGKAKKGKKLHFDHCHVFGKFRGWLCGSCNWIFGLAHDDPKRLKALINYLNKCDR